MNYLDIDTVLAIHKKAIQKYGGSYGLRDKGLLQSAINQPRQTMFDQELYANVFAKAGILLFSLIKNHPFVDGNKRTGISATVAFLYLNGYRLKAPSLIIYHFVIDIAESKIAKEDIPDWLEANCVPIEK